MRSLCITIVGFAMFVTPLAAQDDIAWKIRREAKENSQILETLHIFTDRYGPRLTGSPNLEAAGKWAVDQMTAWGFENAHLESWAPAAPRAPRALFPAPIRTSRRSSPVYPFDEA